LKIFGRRTRSPLNLPFALSVENPDKRGRTLNVGETVILEKEINRFVIMLCRRGITVTGLHNHWLFQNSGYKYIHWQLIDNPVTCANKSMEAARAVGYISITIYIAM
jgi:hypothetical protein